MTITLDEATEIISVPQADLTLISGTLYELDTNAFRLEVGALLDNERYIWMDPVFAHNGEVTVAGTTFARTVEVLSPYSVQFTPDAQYSVRLIGSNNNIFDVENAILVQNQVQIISTNSAGLIVTTSSGATAAQVWQYAAETGFTAEEMLRLIASGAAGKVSGAGTTNIKIRDLNDTKDRIDATVTLDPPGDRTNVILDGS